MMEAIRKLIKDCLTGIDNETFDVWRLSAFLALLALIADAGLAVYRTSHFNAQDFGIGAAAILGGAAWGIRQKKDTEPQGDGKKASEE